MNVIALLYGIGAIIDMVWPRAPRDPWYSSYGMTIGAGGEGIGAWHYIGRPLPIEAEISLGLERKLE